MSVADIVAARPPSIFAGLSAGSFGFAVRIWIAAVLALLVSFWLQLEAPSSAMITVMILAEPTRGQALEKAAYRLIATAIGVVVAIVITDTLSQTRDLLLVAFAVWIGFCVYVCGLLDEYRAYAAVLSGYTVAFIAIQQIDAPLHVFETAMERGAAIAVGVLSVTLVNDLLLAPDRYPQIAAQLAALQLRVRKQGRAVIHGEAADASAIATLIRDIVALRPGISSLAAESSVGPVRSTAARSAIVALVAELHALRTLAALPVIPDPALRERLACAVDVRLNASPGISAGSNDTHLPLAEGKAFAWAADKFLKSDAQVSSYISALDSATSLPHYWRAPLYCSQRIAIESGVRASAAVGAASTLLVLAGWPSTSVVLSLVAVIIGLGATTPAPRTFTLIGFIGAPIAVFLAGILEFVVLNGASDFPLLAIGLAPFVIGAALLTALSNRTLSGLGKINLIFISVVLAASNPQMYDPQAFLFTSLFVCSAMGLLLAA